jgi:alkane 1-monooxygenase
MSPAGWYYTKFLAFTAFPAIPLLVPIGHYLHVPFLSPVFVFVGIPFLDLLIGADRTSPLDYPSPKPVSLWLYINPHLYVLTWLPTLLWSANMLATAALTPYMTVSILIGAATASAFATCAAHELLHRPAAFDRSVSRLVMATVAYGHFVTEHLHHHATVGIVRGGTTPVRGQGVWSFVLQNTVFSFQNSWRIERRRQLAACAPVIANVYVQQLLSTALIVALFVLLAGWWGFLLIATQALFAVFSLEYINYAEHYGLVREQSEPLSGRFAWSSNGFATNALTLNITRHAHHHLRPGVPYHQLRHMQDMPLLPAGYFALFLPALLPPLWRLIMDRQLIFTQRSGVGEFPRANWPPAD